MPAGDTARRRRKEANRETVREDERERAKKRRDERADQIARLHTLHRILPTIQLPDRNDRPYTSLASHPARYQREIVTNPEGGDDKPNEPQRTQRREKIGKMNLASESKSFVLPLFHLLFAFFALFAVHLASAVPVSTSAMRPAWRTCGLIVVMTARMKAGAVLM